MAALSIGNQLVDSRTNIIVIVFEPPAGPCRTAIVGPCESASKVSSTQALGTPVLRLQINTVKEIPMKLSLLSAALSVMAMSVTAGTNDASGQASTATQARNDGKKRLRHSSSDSPAVACSVSS